MAGGDVPYSGFRLAHPPLTFLFQALLIRAFGPAYLAPMLYTSIIGGATTALTYVIVRRLLRDGSTRPDLLAFLLCLPLVPLGVYAILPDPHYDPDAMFYAFVAITLLFVARERPTRPAWLVAGASLAVPLFVKQNIGGALLAAVLSALVIDAIADRARARWLAWYLVGTGAALAVALAALQFAAGLDNYLMWTLRYAMDERGIRLDRFLAFTDTRLIVIGLAMAASALGARFAPRPFRVPLLASVMVVPLFFVMSATVVAAWVPILVAAMVLTAIAAARGHVTFETLMPLVTGATLAGTIQSTGLGSSSFATYPLLVVTVACLIRESDRWVGALDARVAPALTVLLSGALLWTGSAYTFSNAGLAFIDTAPSEPLERSTYPTLRGLSARGPYVSELDLILAWIGGHVGPGEPMTFLPGEDPIYYALGAVPGLPAVQFFDGSNAYTPEELSDIARRTSLRWVFVKDRRQLLAPDDLPQGPVIVELLTRDADLVEIVGPYRIYRRR